MDLNNINVFIPLVTAILTFILTSLFSLYKERKYLNISNRVFIDYGEFPLRYPFKNIKTHGEGILLRGENGYKVVEEAKGIDGGLDIPFLVLKNITNNETLNVKITTAFSGKDLKSQVKEEFVLPIWKSTDTIYIPQKIFEEDSSLSTNEALIIEYCTTSFEKFRYSYKRTKGGKYKEKLEKNYLKYFWIKKITYHKSTFFSFEKIVNK